MAARGKGGLFNGNGIPYTPISVDYFHRGSLPARTLYFLTHLHADHLYGLDSSFDQTIYCTAVTKRLLLLQISLDPELLVELQLDEPQQIRVNCSEYVMITVTAIDSHHCPGSAMFLFQGYFGTILHTGDFRLSPELMTHPLLTGLEPDVLYLDNTYNNQIYMFPERSVTRDKVTQLVVDNPQYRTMLAFNKLGKEELLIDIAKHTSYMIGVSVEQYKKMQILQLDHICSLQTDQCQVVVVPFYSVTPSNVDRWVSECPTQVIIPTCRYIGHHHSLSTHPSVTVVHYSDHCSYTELCQFVELVKPVNIQPIVKRKEVSNVSSFAPFLSSRQPTDYEMPKSIRSLLYSRETGRYRPGSLRHSTSVKRLLKIPRGVHFLSPDKNLKIRSEKQQLSDTTACSHYSERYTDDNHKPKGRTPNEFIRSSVEEEEIVIDQLNTNEILSVAETDVISLSDVEEGTPSMKRPRTCVTNGSLHDHFESELVFNCWFNSTACQLAHDQQQCTDGLSTIDITAVWKSVAMATPNSHTLDEFVRITAAHLASEQLSSLL